MELCNRTEGDAQYRVYLNAPNWVAEVKNLKTGEEKTESWGWAAEPRFGPDIEDVNRADEVLDRLIFSLGLKGRILT